jgi:DNA polymerase-4
VTLKYRDPAFRTFTRAHTLERPTCESNELFAEAFRLFEGLHEGGKVRLLGVSVSHFEPEPEGQLGLFAPGAPSEEAREASRADRLRDELRRRFGPDAVTRASLLGRRVRRTISDRVPED